MLEKIGLPPKPSVRGNNWVVDASHCQGCSSQFTFINRKLEETLSEQLISNGKPKCLRREEEAGFNTQKKEWMRREGKKEKVQKKELTVKNLYALPFVFLSAIICNDSLFNRKEEFSNKERNRAQLLTQLYCTDF